MSEQNDQGKNFPEGYEHVEERMNATKQLLDQIDGQIENMPPDRGPAPRLVPKGTPSIIQPGREQKIAFLKDQKERVKSDAWNKTEMETRDADAATRTQVRDTIREELFPNPFRGKNKEGLLNHKGEVKDLEASQNYMDARRLEFKSSYLVSLSYGKTADNKADVSNTPSKDRQPEHQKD